MGNAIRIYIYIHIWRASEASETLSGLYKFELVRYICLCNSSGRSEIWDKFHECLVEWQ